MTRGAEVLRWQPMKPLLLVIVLGTLPLCSCSTFGTGTTMYYPDGHRAFATSGDNTGIEVNMPGAGSFKALTNTHSSVVASRGSAYSQVIQTAGDAVSKAGGTFAKTAIKP